MAAGTGGTREGTRRNRRSEDPPSESTNGRSDVDRRPEANGKPHRNGRPATSTSKKRFIVVDGANVAFESPSDHGKPRLGNILAVCRVLAERGYEPIVIVDAALRHKIDDPEQLEALIDAKKILQAPAGTDADFFVLETAAQQHACVVSNDTYKDRIASFPWIRERRVPVMFAAGEVQLYVENLV